MRSVGKEHFGERGDYNPILYYISLADPYALGTLLNDKQLQTLNINITNSNKVGTSHIYFAMKCGVWNGIVDQVAGLSDTAGIISDLFSGGDRISELWTGLKKLDIWCTETQGPNNVCIWSLIKKPHTGQTCQVAEQVGVDAANVLTIAISFAKIGQVAKVAQLMESLDAMSQVLKLTSKVIKPVLVGTGKATKIVFKVTKAFLQPGVKFTKLNGRLFSVLIPIPIDLTPNLEAAINKAKELLAKNKEAFDLEVQIKKDAKGVEITDQNGNLVAELEVDGQKIEVLVNPDESKLKESAEEILNAAGNWATAIGKNIDELVEAPLGYQIFTKNGSKYIRRIDATNINTPRLMVDETGAVVKYAKPQRLANSTKLRSNLEKVIGKAPDNHQAHHVVPSNVVEKSALHQEAMKRGLYDVDRAGNGKFLAETDEDLLLEGASIDFPTHFGSHPNYDIQIRTMINNYDKALLTKYGSFDKIPTDDLNKIIDLIENKSLDILTNWKPSKLN